MGFREVPVFDVKEVLRLSLRGEALRSIERKGGPIGVAGDNGSSSLLGDLHGAGPGGRRRHVLSVLTERLTMECSCLPDVLSQLLLPLLLIRDPSGRRRMVDGAIGATAPAGSNMGGWI